MDAWLLVTNPDGSVDGDCPTALGGLTDARVYDVSTTTVPIDVEVVESDVIVTDTDATVSDADLDTRDICRTNAGSHG